MFKIEGLDDLEQALNSDMIMDQAKRIVNHHGAELERAMKTKAIFVKGYGIGFTKGGIATSFPIADKGLSVMVAPQSHYAAYLEYGTRFMSAQPFVQPALELVKPQFVKDMQDLIKIQKNMK